MLQVLKILLIEMNFKNKNAKEQAVLILDIVEDILYYIENEMKIDEEIENKDNVALNMIIDKVKELKFENKKLQKSKQFLANMLKIKDEEQPKDLHIIKQEFDKIYDKTRVYYEKEITELGEVIAGLRKELDYYKNVVKKYNGKIIS